jgi:hypothetical protein
VVKLSELKQAFKEGFEQELNKEAQGVMRQLADLFGSAVRGGDSAVDDVFDGYKGGVQGPSGSPIQGGAGNTLAVRDGGGALANTADSAAGGGMFGGIQDISLSPLGKGALGGLAVGGTGTLALDGLLDD